MSALFASCPAPGGDQRRILSAGAFGLLAVLILLGALHEQVAPFAAGAAGAGQPLAPPGALRPFGTDLLGRDLWSETLHATAATLSTAAAAFGLALVFGVFAGPAAAHLAGRTGTALRAAAHVFVSIPPLLLAVLLASLIGAGNFALAAGMAAAPAAFVRGFDRASGIRAAPFAQYARAGGASGFDLLRRDLLHELRETAIGTLLRLFASIMVMVSAMSFLGFGAAPPARDLGLMIASARASLPGAWWTAAGPVLMLALIVLAARLAARPGKDA